MPTDWSPDSWRRFPAAQMPTYRDVAAVGDIERVLATAEPVALPDESAALRTELARAVTGQAFVLQGGDCAETFTDNVQARVDGLSGLFAEMTAILAVAGTPVTKIARIAGQFAKPRTAEFEQSSDAALPAYRGDMVNAREFTPEARTPDPRRMLRGHRQSLATARLLRGIHTSHEALLLPYEQALTRRVGERWWATSAHMLWLGDRTRQIGGAHVEYLSGIENVIGVKCGPSIGPDELLRLAERLEPTNRPGRLVLIPRLGAGRIGDKLPLLMRAAQCAGLNALWVCDPMHGNTALSGGRKVRQVDDILSELRGFFAIARSEGVHPGGVHLEMTPFEVTECIGGPGPATVGEMERNYATACDPRLNRGQAVGIARAVAALAAPAPKQTAAA